jgi:hypothetical protein
MKKFAILYFITLISTCTIAQTPDAFIASANHGSLLITGPDSKCTIANGAEEDIIIPDYMTAAEEQLIKDAISDHRLNMKAYYQTHTPPASFTDQDEINAFKLPYSKFNQFPDNVKLFIRFNWNYYNDDIDIFNALPTINTAR